MYEEKPVSEGGVSSREEGLHRLGTIKRSKRDKEGHMRNKQRGRALVHELVSFNA